MADHIAEYRRRIREQAEQQKRAAERERNESTENAKIEKVVGAIDRVVEKIDRQTDENAPHNRNERKWQRAEVIGLWAAAAVGVIAIIVSSIDSGSQRSVMQGQLDEMQAARRPWIDVQATIAGPLTFGPTPNFDLKIVVKNLGQSPALEVWPNVSMFLFAANDAAAKEIPKRCADLRKQELAKQAGDAHAPGYMLFPAHSTEITRHVVLDTIRKGGLFPMHILICGDYRFTYAPEQHSTDILYTLTTDMPKLPDAMAIMTPGNWNALIDSRLGKIEAEHLKLYYEPFGDTYAN